ncbi:MAG: glycosyltransferase family 2 protein [Pedobacter sp.]
MQKRISIALATFNGEKYIREQLCSFIEQTQQPDELIICDDCSTDSTVDIVRKFADIAQFEIKIFVNKIKIGYAQNFSKALQYCTGDIIFLSDQDDVWLSNKIKRVVSFFADDPEIQLLIHDLEYCRGDLTPIGQTKIERMHKVFDLERCYVVGMATAIRRPFLQLCLPIPSECNVAHDFWLHCCAGAIGKKRIICEVLSKYRRHSSNVTTTGSLNVDFITTSRYFHSERVKHKTALHIGQISQFYGWLQANRTALIERNFTSPEHIDRVIKEEGQRRESAASRAEILAIRRLMRFWPVLSLFSRGGYRFFSGWKSAMKDLFLN